MKASVCIASFNRNPNVLRRTLKSVCFQKPPFEFEVIVVDDGSQYGANQVHQDFPVLYHRIDRPPVTRNPSVARNAAYRLASGGIIVAQSDDVEHQQDDSIELLCKEIDAHPESFIIATVLGSDEQGAPAKVLTGSWNGHRRHMPLFFLGAVWRRDVYAIGGNDEDFARTPGNGGHEDKWFADCLMNGLGRTPLYTDKVVGKHQWHPRSSNNKQMRRNGRLYDAKHAAATITGKWCSADNPWET